jgi:hypothetical protein
MLDQKPNWYPQAKLWHNKMNAQGPAPSGPRQGTLEQYPQTGPMPARMDTPPLNDPTALLPGPLPWTPGPTLPPVAPIAPAPVAPPASVRSEGIRAPAGAYAPQQKSKGGFGGFGRF